MATLQTCMLFNRLCVSFCSNPSFCSPRVRYAAVSEVKYAVTYYRERVPRFTRGGVMLCELMQGGCECILRYRYMSCTDVRSCCRTVVIIVIGGSYDRTIESMRVSSTLEIIPDNVSIRLHIVQSLAFTQ